MIDKLSVKGYLQKLIPGFRQDTACSRKWIPSSRKYGSNKIHLGDSLGIKIKRALANSEIVKHAQGLLMDCISANLKNNIWDRADKFQCVISALEEDTRYAKFQFLLCDFCL